METMVTMEAKITTKELIFGKETKWWPVETMNWPICQFHSLLHDHESRLDLNPSYQRGLVWDLEHKEKLIDSLITGLGIPSVYLRLRRDYSYEVIDGKQRIHAICSFMDDGFPFNGKLYSEHDVISRRSFENTTVGTTVLKFISQSDAVEIYNRINFNGVPHEPSIRVWHENIKEAWNLEKPRGEITIMDTHEKLAKIEIILHNAIEEDDTELIDAVYEILKRVN